MRPRHSVAWAASLPPWAAVPLEGYLLCAGPDSPSHCPTGPPCALTGVQDLGLKPFTAVFRSCPAGWTWWDRGFPVLVLLTGAPLPQQQEVLENRTPSRSRPGLVPVPRGPTKGQSPSRRWLVGKKGPSRPGRPAAAGASQATGRHGIVSRGSHQVSLDPWQGPESGESPTVQSPLPPHVTVVTLELLSLPVWELKGKRREREKGSHTCSLLKSPGLGTPCSGSGRHQIPEAPALRSVWWRGCQCPEEQRPEAVMAPSVPAIS